MHLYLCPVWEVLLDLNHLASEPDTAVTISRDVQAFTANLVNIPALLTDMIVLNVFSKDFIIQYFDIQTLLNQIFLPLKVILTISYQTFALLNIPDDISFLDISYVLDVLL